MTKLIEALANLAIAATSYLERETHPMLPLAAAGAVDAPAPKKEKKAKAATEKAPEAPAPAATQPQAPAAALQPAVNADPLADLMGSTSAPVPQAPASPALTPEQSILEMKKAAFGVVKAFPAVTGNGANGAPSTEGEDKLRALLGNMFKVAKLMDLTHENRLLFIAEATKLVAAGVK